MPRGACQMALARWFVCPDCDGKAHCIITRGARELFQCNAAASRLQCGGNDLRFEQIAAASVVQGHVSLTQSKQGMSSLELARRLGITQNAAWKMKHKLAQVMLERNATKRLKGKCRWMTPISAASAPARAGAAQWQDALRRRSRDNERRQATSDHPAARQGVQ